MFTPHEDIYKRTKIANKSYKNIYY
jgi:hypothetical protein